MELEKTLKADVQTTGIEELKSLISQIQSQADQLAGTIEKLSNHEIQVQANLVWKEED
ncbi:hypothetical protein QP246_02290 [Aerococcus urinae]|uniref:hypothetical protein n=1 Tax=Aerococcus urinae TaxID=1376 RepID=UPI00254D8978|nr:hypothetical protein [Aerococcus urinae]MDK6688288.1 hypothetical protein [Aerococcus urinae]